MYRLLLIHFLMLFVLNLQAQTLQDAINFIKQGDYENARKSFESLAIQGNAKAQYNLGKMYESGDGITQDLNAAAHWYALSADQSFSEAQYALAAMVFKRNINSTSYEQAVALYIRAAEQGHTKSQLNLGLLYYRGEVVEANALESAKWLALAAEQDNAEAQSYLGNMYANGVGFEKNLVTAAMWMILSVENKDSLHKNRHTKLLNFTLSSMTAEQVSEAQKKALACKQSTLKSC